MRINVIEPRLLADQHLVAEYNEILMLLGYVRQFPEPKNIPEKYCLGPGHIKFFKDKLRYVKKRHELLKKEMHRRGFATNKTIMLSEFPVNLRNDWEPSARDRRIILQRLREKLKMKPQYYRYEGAHQPTRFFLTLLSRAAP